MLSGGRCGNDLFPSFVFFPAPAGLRRGTARRALEWGHGFLLVQLACCLALPDKIAIAIGIGIGIEPCTGVYIVIEPKSYYLCQVCTKPTLDEAVKSRNSHFFVIPAQAGIHSFQWVLDAGSSPA